MIALFMGGSAAVASSQSATTTCWVRGGCRQWLNKKKKEGPASSDCSITTTATAATSSAVAATAASGQLQRHRRRFLNHHHHLLHQSSTVWGFPASFRLSETFGVALQRHSRNTTMAATSTLSQQPPAAIDPITNRTFFLRNRPHWQHFEGSESASGAHFNFNHHNPPRPSRWTANRALTAAEVIAVTSIGALSAHLLSSLKDSSAAGSYEELVGQQKAHELERFLDTTSSFQTLHVITPTATFASNRNVSKNIILPSTSSGTIETSAKSTAKAIVGRPSSGFSWWRHPAFTSPARTTNNWSQILTHFQFSVPSVQQRSNFAIPINNNNNYINTHSSQSPPTSKLSQLFPITLWLANNPSSAPSTTPVARPAIKSRRANKTRVVFRRSEKKQTVSVGIQATPESSLSTSTISSSSFDSSTTTAATATSKDSDTPTTSTSTKLDSLMSDFKTTTLAHHAQACMTLATSLLSRGPPTILSDTTLSAAASLLESALSSAQDDTIKSRACFNLGLIAIRKGHEGHALTWMRKAQACGHTKAGVWVAALEGNEEIVRTAVSSPLKAPAQTLEEERLVDSTEVQQLIESLEKDVNRGCFVAAYNLAVLLTKTLGNVERDRVLRLFEMAAKCPDASVAFDALHNLKVLRDF